MEEAPIERKWTIALSDNAFGAVLCVALCQGRQHMADGEAQKARAQAGICTDGLDRQSKCK